MPLIIECCPRRKDSYPDTLHSILDSTHISQRGRQEGQPGQNYSRVPEKSHFTRRRVSAFVTTEYPTL